MGVVYLSGLTGIPLMLGVLCASLAGIIGRREVELLKAAARIAPLETAASQADIPPLEWGLLSARPLMLISQLGVLLAALGPGGLIGGIVAAIAVGGGFASWWSRAFYLGRAHLPSFDGYMARFRWAWLEAALTLLGCLGVAVGWLLNY